MQGILLLDKPVGLSSNAALQRVRRLAGGVKAGHAGSLDPLASGMLPICLGAATRLAGELLEGRKVYRTVVKLGERTATGDTEGEVLERCVLPPLDAARIEQVLGCFRGEQTQVPPMYSALKRDGQPLYRLARQGVTVERAARGIVIERLELLDWTADRLTLAVHCSKGTYVRVLGEDIARALGSCGHLAGLRREYVEPFGQDPMATLESLEATPPADWPLLAPERAVAHLPLLALGAGAAEALRHGKTLPREGWQLAGADAREGLWRLHDASGSFMGLGASDLSGVLRVRRLLPVDALAR
jgi:tRNA pseudouridine55 synthase